VAFRSATDAPNQTGHSLTLMAGRSRPLYHRTVPSHPIPRSATPIIGGGRRPGPAPPSPNSPLSREIANMPDTKFALTGPSRHGRCRSWTAGLDTPGCPASLVSTCIHTCPYLCSESAAPEENVGSCIFRVYHF
jgi:hypothetical protein